MKKIIIILVVVLITSGCFGFGEAKEDKRFTLDKLFDEYDQDNHTFKNYDEGEVISIQDKIEWIYYDLELDKTLIVFKSTPTRPFAFVSENGTNDFTSNYVLMPGDSVELEIHIVELSNGEETIQEWLYEWEEDKTDYETFGNSG